MEGGGGGGGGGGHSHVVKRKKMFGKLRNRDQELCESRGDRPGRPVLVASMDLKCNTEHHVK